MKLPLALIAVIAISLFESGCVFSSADVAVRRLNHEAAASGSPYRWRSQSVSGGQVVEKYRITPPTPSPVPSGLRPTSADSKLQKDILANIDNLQKEWGCSVSPALLGVQLLSIADGSVKELWFVKQDSGAIQYKVTMILSPNGGTDLHIEGP